MSIAHGKFTITVKDNIVLIKLQGAFNENGATLLAQETKRKIEKFHQKPFFILADLLALEGATPAAFAISNEFNQWLNTQALIAKAIVIISETIKAIDLAWVPAKQLQRVEYFTNEADAFNWLQQCSFPITAE